MITLGDAEKTFEELKEGDSLYYIDPKKPSEIQALTIKCHEEFRPKPNYTILRYYKSSDALSLVADKDMIPTATILVEKKAKRIVTLSHPPTVYFTNKKALQKFIDGK